MNTRPKLHIGIFTFVHQLYNKMPRKSLFLTLVGLLLWFAVPCMEAATSKLTPQQIIDKAAQAYSKGDNLGALHFCQEFMRSRNSNPGGVSEAALIACYRMLGNVHFNYRDFSRAMRYYESGLSLAMKSADKTDAAKLLNNLSMAASISRDSLTARKWLLRSDAYSLGDPFVDKAMWLIRHALFERSFGNPDRAITLMKGADATIISSDLNPSLRLTPISEIFQIYEHADRLDSALYYLDVYSRLATQYNAVGMMVDAERGYMRVLARLPGKQEEVRRHQERYFALQDSLLDTQAFMNLSQQYEDDLKREADAKIETLQFKVSKLEFILVIISVVALIAIIVYFWIRNSIRMRKAYTYFFRANRDMAFSLSSAPAKETPKLVEPAEKPAVATQRDGVEAAEEVATSETEENLLAPEVSADRKEAEAGKLQMQDTYDRIAAEIEKVMKNSDEWLDADFSISKLASLVGSNTKYVSACINERTGKNFRTFINEYRIRTALERMSDPATYGNFTIGAIAESVGFRSSSNFISAFRKVTGITPSLYLKLQNE